MAGRYGMSFAKSLIEKGDYEEAIASATEEIEGGNAGPEPLFDRATALELEERFAEAVEDFQRAIEVNDREKELDPFVLDDAFFSALLSASRQLAEAKKIAEGVGMLDRYARLLPAGAHVQDARDWQKRLRGEMPSLLDKTRDFG